MNSPNKILIILSSVLVIGLAVASYFGAFDADTYIRETPSLAVQGVAQDLVNLFLVVPLLILSLYFSAKGNRFAFFILGGTVLYVLYSYFIYTFGIHFNKLFLVYCLTLGTAFYAFILIVLDLARMQFPVKSTEQLPLRFMGVFLLIVAFMFYSLWLKEIVPAILQDTLPPSVSDYNLLVNPVHVLDTAILLPALIVTAILLFKKKPFGLILAPMLLVFIIILAIALVAMVIMLKIKGLEEDISAGVIFIALAFISFIFLLFFQRAVKMNTEGPFKE
ncbi:MAG: hypothetical protein Kow0042_09040 [Calditrichia bacterium]